MTRRSIGLALVALVVAAFACENTDNAAPDAGMASRCTVTRDCYALGGRCITGLPQYGDCATGPGRAGTIQFNGDPCLDETCISSEAPPLRCCVPTPTPNMCHPLDDGGECPSGAYLEPGPGICCLPAIDGAAPDAAHEAGSADVVVSDVVISDALGADAID